MEQRAFKNLGIFFLILVGLKFFLGWNISIIGSLLLTVALSIVISLAGRR